MRNSLEWSLRKVGKFYEKLTDYVNNVYPILDLNQKIENLNGILEDISLNIKRVTECMNKEIAYVETVEQEVKEINAIFPELQGDEKAWAERRLPYCQYTVDSCQKEIEEAKKVLKDLQKLEISYKDEDSNLRQKINDFSG